MLINTFTAGNALALSVSGGLMGLPMTLQGLNYTNRGRISPAHHLDPTLTFLDAAHQRAA